jgi:hypothetical protein
MSSGISPSPERARASAQPALLVTGIVLAFSGQLILLTADSGRPSLGEQQLIAGLLLILGAVLFALGARRLPNAELQSQNGFEEAGQSLLSRPFQATGGAISGALAVLGIAIFAQKGESPLIVGLWAASILILLATQLPRPGLAWAAGLRREWPYLAALVPLLLLCYISSTYKLATLPYNFDGDFADFGVQARALLTGQQPHIFGFGWANIPLLGFAPAWLSLKLFGNDLVGLRSSGVVEGLLIVIGVYLLGRDLFNPRVGLIAAALVVASYARIAGSRECQYIDPVFFMVFSVYFFVLALREGKGWAAVVSGFMAAFCLNVYYSGRLVFPLVGCIFILLLVLYRPLLFKRGGILLVWLLALLVSVGPMGFVFFQNLDSFLSRSREVFVLSPQNIKHMSGVFAVNSVPALLWQQARHSLLLFHYYGDTGTQFAFRRPLLDPITAPLFTLGLGLAFFGFRRLGNFIMSIWIVLGIIVGCFLTINPPFWTRLLVLFPPAALLAALALDAIYLFLRDRLQLIARPTWLIAPVALALLLAWISIRNWNTYVEQEATYATDRTRIGRFLATQSPETRAYLVTSVEGVTYHDREFNFLIPGKLVANLTPDQLKPDIPRVGSPTMLILTGEEQPVAEQLPRLIPGGILTPGSGNSAGEVSFYIFQLP